MSRLENAHHCLRHFIPVGHEIRCGLCSLIFRNRRQAVPHFVRDHIDLHYYCRVCDYTNSDTLLVLQHAMLHALNNYRSPHRQSDSESD